MWCGEDGKKCKLIQKRHFIINFTLGVLCYAVSFNASLFYISYFPATLNSFFPPSLSSLFLSIHQKLLFWVDINTHALKKYASRHKLPSVFSLPSTPWRHKANYAAGGMKRRIWKIFTTNSFKGSNFKRNFFPLSTLFTFS